MQVTENLEGNQADVMGREEALVPGRAALLGWLSSLKQRYRVILSPLEEDLTGITGKAHVIGVHSFLPARLEVS